MPASDTPGRVAAPRAPRLTAATIRGYLPGDHDAVYDVCTRTGDAGNDGRRKFRQEDLLPDIYAGLYIELEPELAFVVDDGGTAVGYMIGSADTAAFVRSAVTLRWGEVPMGSPPVRLPTPRGTSSTTSACPHRHPSQPRCPAHCRHPTRGSYEHRHDHHLL